MVGYLVLENGEIFEGDRIGYNTDTVCEVVFNTSMVGYIETLTDPSYYGQGIVMTYPLIGNYGVMPEDYESDGIFAKAVFVHEVAEFESNFRAKFNFDKFLRDYKVPGLTNINTRKLVRVLRDFGTMKGYVTSNISDIDEIMKKIKEYHVKNAVDKVTSKQVKVYGRGKSKKVAVIDTETGCIGQGLLIIKTAQLVEEHIGISKDYNNFEFLSAVINKDSYKVNSIIK